MSKSIDALTFLLQPAWLPPLPSVDVTANLPGYIILSGYQQITSPAGYQARIITKVTETTTRSLAVTPLSTPQWVISSIFTIRYLTENSLPVIQ